MKPTKKLESELRNDYEAENLQLRDEVKRQAIELERKNRELNIESALERVRARTMAMHHSEELKEIITVLLKELKELGMAMENRSAIIFVVEHGQRLMTQWVVSRFQPLATGIRTPYYDNPILADFWEAWEMKTEFYEKSYPKKEKNTLFSYFFNELGFEMPEESRELIFQIPHYSLAVAIEKNSSVALASHTKEKLTTGEADLLKRFAAVFERAYIRFLDLQKAEAQAREAQIEAALEKIRSTSLAMQRSSEIDKVANVLYEKLKELGLEFDGGAAIILFTEGSMDANIGVVSPLTPPTFHRLPWDEDALADNPIMVDEWKAKDEKIDIINKFYSFEQKNRYFQYVFKHNGEDKLPVTVREFILNTKSYTATFIAEKNSLVGVNSWTEQLLSEADIIVLRRIARVFEQAYIRFLDLQKAEAQAREAQIETALERVRARAMAMYTSEELMEVVKELRKQVGLLGQPELTTCVIQLYDESPDYIYSWVSMQASESDRENIDFRQAPVPKKGLLIQEEALEAYLSGGKDYTLLNEKGKLKQWVGFIKETYPEAYEAFVATVKDPEHVPAYWSFSDFTGGSLLMVTMAPPTRESKEMLRRFANVFGLAYRRFVDLKQAEARAREAQIEASMERVRSRTMAMHKSAELGEVAVLLYSELMALGVTQQFFECGYVEVDEVNKIQRAWMTKPDGGLVEPFNLPLIGEPVFDARYEAWKQRVPVFHQAVGGDQLRRHLEFAIPYFGSKEVEEIARTQVPDAIIFYCANFSHGYLSIASGTILSVEAESLLARFTRVFEMTYKRFVDLQNAEAQAREAQIQLALERVRARTMAMNKSDELAETAQLLYHEFGTLGLPTYTCGYMFVNEQTMTQSIWAVKPDGSLLRDISTLPLTGNPVLDERYSDWKAQKPLHIRCVEGEENKEHHRFLKEHAGPGFAENFFSHTPERLVFYCANFSKGYLAILARDYLPKEAEDIIIRFSRAFDQTYTRFLDLQNAEAQARESQIQLALERVRARTMAMQKSSELADVATILFQQVKALGIPQWVCGFSIWEIGDKEFTWYPGSPDGNILTPCKVPLNEHPVFISFDESRRRGDELFVYEKEGEFQAGHYRYMMTIPGMRELLQNMLDAGLSFPTFQIDHIANFSHGNLVFITYEHFPEMHDVFKRFAKVFDQTYTRFLDLQTAEAQARESQIQLALERVRARTMAMQHSEELGDAATIMFHQLKQLGINLWAATFDIWKPGDPAAMEYAAGPDGRFFKPFRNPIDYNDPFVKYALEERKMGKELIEINLSGPALAEANKRLLTQPETREVFESIVRAGYKFPEIQFNYFAFFSHGFLQFISTERYPESQDIFIRMAKVFEQTYTRFLDLQKAEAQARESQIQLALERVRARTMAMQKSEELREVTIVLYDQLKDLGFKYGVASITLMDVATGDMDWWLEGLKDGFRFLERYHVNYFDHKSHIEQLDYWKKGTSFATIIVSGEDKKAFDNVYFNQSDFKRIPDETKARMMGQETVVFSMAYMLYGALSWSSPGIIADEQAEILQRFAKVFEQTYTRFLDLQKAEAQAREAQIEAALEKVRSRSLAMHQSNELEQVVLSLFGQLEGLGLSFDGAGIYLFDKEKRHIQLWIATRHLPAPVLIDLPPDDAITNNAFNLDLWHAIETGEHIFNRSYSGQTKNDYFRYVAKYNGPKIPEQIKQLHIEKESWTLSLAAGKNSALGFDTWSGDNTTNEDFQILLRFNKVFEQAYTRFLDLQKAEAQAREAQIEAALERVRSRSMAMHKSDEVMDVAVTLNDELDKIGFKSGLTSIIIMNKETGDTEHWMAGLYNKNFPQSCHVPYFKHPSYEAGLNAWKKGEKYFAQTIAGDEKKSLDEHWFTKTGFKSFPQSQQDRMRQHESMVVSQAYMKYGAIGLAPDPLSEEQSLILQRFAKVFEQTYTRFLDLKKAEAQAREAQIESALERVRSRTLAMQKSDELAETASVLFKQLIHLGIEARRLYINIVKDDAGNAEFWITDEDGSKVTTAYSANLNANATFKKIFGGWKSQKKSIIIDIQGKELEEYFQHLSSLNVRFKRRPEQKRRLQYIAYFSRGFIGMASPDEQPAETLQLLERFAAAFNLTFTRFNDLNIAEAHALQAEQDLVEIKAAREKAEEALTELQATQKQLIQSEKMASLGELTAGIAHEIQNPLNFVNNFSDVSNELLEEMKEQLAIGNGQQAIALANDVKQNLEKINHHGRRADAIVKGMLQHSRTSSGQKEPTDINALCDEYLRLAYHGLRAKDKSFNAKFETDFDNAIGKIDIIPQEIGRAILNMINNAFYAVKEKKKLASTGLSAAPSRDLQRSEAEQAGSALEGYEPLVVISSKKLGDDIEIRIKDNGMGIPEKILDKIFQPFFTTKPSGQGTGLGLSLAYDIITNGHRGELAFVTEEGEGTEFIIQLPYKG